MSVIVIGISHRTADIATLERVVLNDVQQDRIGESLVGNEHVSELLVLSTCNRTELYAEVGTFHGAVTSISETLAAVTGMPLPALRDHLYVHFEDRAVAHLFSVAAGLDSMAIGESQILGQLRASMRAAQDAGRLGSSLSELVQHALRVGKRVHAETDLDTVSRSLVEQSLGIAQEHLGALSAQSAVVIGAGSMSALAAHTLTRAGVGGLTIVNRTPEHGQRLAAATGAIARPWAQLTDALAGADIVISCTGAVGHILVPHLLTADGPPARHMVLIDLALPRDIDPACGELDGVTLVTLEELGARTTADGPQRDSLRVVQDLVTAEVAEFLVLRRSAAVVPTVSALRVRAADVVDAEMDRLVGRLQLTDAQAAQVRQTLHRVTEKILHTPTVRMKQLAGEEHGQDYAALLRTLFDLDPHEARVSRVPRLSDGDRR
ncbi:glutamyl-tRNA reductase [Allobranchiibius huperziae]|uniref:Glutamyl-tRNA reductase n=1 Tax=Allobranchiibius huperziae TaxID=1874116 RepID=A0A853DAA0_9MICO|nr:glutamyl-tRNA reductase [Allobranchiibius huperziae]NYJ73517.1 glutamyl-tRNA reductase [Allobranchiibius huperziae]